MASCCVVTTERPNSGTSIAAWPTSTLAAGSGTLPEASTEPPRSAQVTSAWMFISTCRDWSVGLSTTMRFVSATIRVVSTLSAFGSPTTLKGVRFSISLQIASVSRSPRSTPGVVRKLSDCTIGT